MAKKSKGVFLDSTPGPGVVVCLQDSMARLKLQTLVRHYHELQKEVDATRTKLGAAKKRKVTVAAEVRFLRRRYQSLVKERAMSPPHRMSRSQQMKEEAILEGLPSVSRQQQPSMANLHRGGKKGSKLSSGRSKDGADVKKKKKKKGGKRSEKLVPELRSGFDVLESKAPLFDLNEISVGDEDFQSNNGGEVVKTVEEANASVIMRSSSTCENTLQNDLKLLLCRNAGEGGSSRAGKRKISWQDPVAVRV